MELLLAVRKRAGALVAHAHLRHFPAFQGFKANDQRLSALPVRLRRNSTPKPPLICFARSAHRWESRLAGLASTSHSLPMREQHLAPSFATAHRAAVTLGGKVAQSTCYLRHFVLRTMSSVTGCSA